MKQRLASFWSDDRGAIAATYAMSLIGLVAVAGVAFDYTRLVGLDSELQNGADQAALAGATQLDRADGACARAANAAIGMLDNITLLANDGETNAITISGDVAGLSGNDACEGIDGVVFYTTADGTTVASTDEAARFIEVIVDERSGNYAFTPIVGAVFPDLAAAARAGLGSSVCKVPPIMICSPDPTTPFNAESRVGQGIAATGKNNGNNGGNPGTDGVTDNGGNTWAPGDFGFLQVADETETAGNRNARLLKALAYANPPVNCSPIDGNRVNPGNPQSLYDAVNTRFGIYDFPNNANSGNVLGACQDGACPKAPNVNMDFVKRGNNSCRMGNNNGFSIPDDGEEFKPVFVAGATASTPLSANTPIEAMGLPRDNCHYTSFNSTGECTGYQGRFGTGEWAREDYFNLYHSGGRPTGWETISRYQTYMWEINNSQVRGAHSCGVVGGPERRLLTVAVVTNCSELRGVSAPVEIDEWVDVFLVEPSSDAARRYNAFSDSIYLEVIGKSRVAGSGTYGTQNVRRDVPYLVR